MRKLFFAAVLFFALASCNNAGNTGGTSDAANKTNRVYRAIETGDVSGLDDVFTEDCVDHGAGPLGQDIKGRDSILNNLKQVHNWFDNLKLESIAQATNGDYHFSLVRMTGTSKSPASGLPVGTSINSTSVDVVKLKDGKATDHWGYASMKETLEMMKNTGSMNNSGAAPMPMSTADSAQKMK